MTAFRGNWTRNFTCWECIHGIDYENEFVARGLSVPVSCRCVLTRRKGLIDRGHVCSRFVYKQLSKAMADDGTEIRNRQPLDYRTERQWAEAGRRLKDGAVGKEMYPSRSNMYKKYRYYLIEETEEGV